ASLRWTSSCIYLAWESISEILSGLTMANSPDLELRSLQAKIDHAANFRMEDLLGLLDQGVGQRGLLDAAREGRGHGRCRRDSALAGNYQETGRRAHPLQFLADDLLCRR